MIRTQTLSAGVAVDFPGGNCLNLRSAPAAVTVELLRGGRILDRAADVTTGWYWRPAITPSADTPPAFDAVRITSASTQAVEVETSTHLTGFR